jgi:hypothetical protein
MYLHGLLPRYMCNDVKYVGWDHVQSHDADAVHHPTALEASSRIPQNIIEWVLEDEFVSNVFYIPPSDGI